MLEGLFLFFFGCVALCAIVIYVLAYPFKFISMTVNTIYTAIYNIIWKIRKGCPQEPFNGYWPRGKKSKNSTFSFNGSSNWIYHTEDYQEYLGWISCFCKLHKDYWGELKDILEHLGVCDDD